MPASHLETALEALRKGEEALQTDLEEAQTRVTEIEQELSQTRRCISAITGKPEKKPAAEKKPRKSSGKKGYTTGELTSKLEGILKGGPATEASIKKQLYAAADRDGKSKQGLWIGVTRALATDRFTKTGKGWEIAG